ncbi:MAG: hypothetical protein WBA92_12600 [Pseudorhodobacter sp.]
MIQVRVEAPKRVIPRHALQRKRFPKGPRQLGKLSPTEVKNSKTPQEFPRRLQFL